jgi:sigma-B regulation protein RsbU (phosphoserine phosphatase)
VNGYFYELLPAGSEVRAEIRAKLEPLLSQLLRAEEEILRLGEELALRFSEIELLYTISETLGRSIGLKAAAEIIVRELSEVVGVRRASILVHDEEEGVLRPVAGFGIDVSRFSPIPVDDPCSVAALAFRECRTVSNDSWDPARGLGGCHPERGYRGEAFLSVPIIYPAPDAPPRAVGVVNLTDRVGPDVFGPNDQKLVAAIANQVGAALENARLVEKILARQRADRELELARDLQRKLLALKPGDLSLDTAAHFEPAAFVGGDFYRVLELGRDTVGVMLGDVSSHGFSAALIMVLVLSAAGIHASQTDSPEEMVRRLRRSVAQALEETEMHFSLFYGLVRPSEGTLCYANAGHPHAFRIGHNGAVERLEATAPPLGLGPEERISGARTGFKSGDLLLLFSDGIADAADREGRRLGEERVVELASALRRRPAASIVEAVLEEIGRTGEAPGDDRTLLVLKG